MKIDIELNDSAFYSICWLVVMTIVITIASFISWEHRLDIASDTKLQLAMVEKGFTPFEIGCGWNVNNQACAIKETK